MLVSSLRTHRCPFCRRDSFEGPVWRLHLAEHLFREHPARVEGEVRDFCETAFELVELRAVQRALLLFGLQHQSFTIEQGGDSISLHSMERRGWVRSDEAGEMRERRWWLTRLGVAVARGALQRLRAVDQRVRHPVARTAAFERSAIH